MSTAASTVAACLMGASLSVAAADKAADPCALLSKSEVSAVQGAEITEAKSGQRPGSGVVHRHCFYSAATFDKSVSLEVTVGDKARPAGTQARARWRELFHGQEHGKGTSSRKDEPPGEPEGEEERGPPQRLRGIGEEAYWTTDPRAGALYVLKGHAYFRLSLGGWADQKVRLHKTKILARKIAKRL